MQWHGYKFLVPLHPLSNIEITKYFNYGPTFNGVFSGGNLLRIKDGAYVINHDDKQSEETHLVLLFIDRGAAAGRNSFEIEHL